MSATNTAPAIPGIPTTYRGRNHRSLLEAKWAAMFDLLGWKYEYEPFELNGWIPDYLICGHSPLLVEVKPITEYSTDVARKCLGAMAGTFAERHELMILGCTLPDSGDDGQIGWLVGNGWGQDTKEEHEEKEAEWEALLSRVAETQPALASAFVRAVLCRSSYGAIGLWLPAESFELCRAKDKVSELEAAISRVTGSCYKISFDCIPWELPDPRERTAICVYSRNYFEEGCNAPPVRSFALVPPDGLFHDRVSGNHFKPGDDFDWRGVESLWRQACNSVQWKPAR